MLAAVVSLVGGLALLWAGAELLVRGASSLALRLGVAPLVVGLTVVAFGTSAPELVIGISASVRGEGEIALGNVIGANIANIGWILGVASLIRPLAIRAQLIRIDFPIMIACTFVLAAFLYDGALSRIEGLALASGIFVYTAFALRIARRPASRVLQREFREELPRPKGSATRDVVRGIGGFLLLVAGANLLVGGAIVVARGVGLSEAAIAITVVSLGTTLPELAATVVASLKGEGDLAAGNVVGSNIFNILSVLGFSALANPLDGASIGTADVVVMLLFGVAVLPLARRKEVLDRWEGALLLTAYVAYVGSLVMGA